MISLSFRSASLDKIRRAPGIIALFAIILVGRMICRSPRSGANCCRCVVQNCEGTDRSTLMTYLVENVNVMRTGPLIRKQFICQHGRQPSRSRHKTNLRRTVGGTNAATILVVTWFDLRFIRRSSESLLLIRKSLLPSPPFFNEYV